MDPNQNQHNSPNKASSARPINYVSPEDESASSQSLSQEGQGTPMIRNIVAILLLIFLPLIGLIFVWYLTKWPKWLKKLLLFLIVILPILLILLSVIIIAINPKKISNVPSNSETSTNKSLNFNKPSKIQSDTERRSNVTEILNAIGVYSQDNGGELPAGIVSTSLEISSSGADICSDLLANPNMQSLPVDPSMGQTDIVDCSTEYSTGYFVVKNNDGTVTVSAPNAESGINISITR